MAAGVSSTFAATIGGVLFSIEITTLYYDMGNYFKAFVAAISGTVAVSLVRTLAEGSPVRIACDVIVPLTYCFRLRLYGVRSSDDDFRPLIA